MEFNDKQIEFMKSLGLDLDFNNLSDDDYCEIEDVVGDKYTWESVEHPDRVTKIMIMCESILDSLA